MKKKINNFPYFFQEKFNFLFDSISNIEDRIVKEQNINKPIFICGMPRSGTTLLAHLINTSTTTCSYDYSDLPFIKTPILWKYFKNLYYFGTKKIERPHGDKMEINLNSPDAFEELFWSEYLENYNGGEFCKLLYPETSDPKLEFKFRKFIQKCLYTKKSDRYFSKGNYNIFRVFLLKKYFNDSKFLICYRNPSSTIDSLSKVHKNFIKLSEEIEGFDKNLYYLKHFEFGSSRKPLLFENYENHKTIDLMLQENNNKFYEEQWKCLYNLVLKKYLNETFKKNILLINYDKLINNFEENIMIIFKFCDLKLNEPAINRIQIIKKKATPNQFNLDESTKKIYEKLNFNEFSVLK